MCKKKQSKFKIISGNESEYLKAHNLGVESY